VDVIFFVADPPAAAEVISLWLEAAAAASRLRDAARGRELCDKTAAAWRAAAGSEKRVGKPSLLYPELDTTPAASGEQVIFTL